MDKKQALAKCMKICSVREYCVDDILKKLTNWEISEKDKVSIIEYLISEKFIDNKRYAIAYVKDKFTFNKWGKIKIKYNLKQKHIENSIVDDALNNIIADNDYYNTAKHEIIKKYKTIKGNNDFEIKQKILRYMSSKGFESSVVFDILNKI
jgi:regulatory protein